MLHSPRFSRVFFIEEPSRPPRQSQSVSRIIFWYFCAMVSQKSDTDCPLLNRMLSPVISSLRNAVISFSPSTIIGTVSFSSCNSLRSSSSSSKVFRSSIEKLLQLSIHGIVRDFLQTDCFSPQFFTTHQNNVFCGEPEKPCDG